MAIQREPEIIHAEVLLSEVPGSPRLRNKHDLTWMSWCWS